VGRPGKTRETQAQQAGATPTDLVKVTCYLPGYTPGDTGARDAHGFPTGNLLAATLLGIQSLYSDAALFEHEGIAVMDP